MVTYQSGVRQGCPLSPLLFLLIAEVFGQAIRKCPEIHGFHIPGSREVRISQYAGGNTCIVTNSYGIGKVFDVFNEYGRASGARLNTSKSKGLWLGRWRTRTDSPCGLSWVSTSLKLVGLHFGDENASIKTWDGVFEKFRSVLKKWEPRFMTLRGKTTVLESLAVSTIWHTAKIYPPSRMIIDSIQSSVWKFVWSKKPELVRRETCMSNYSDGGLHIVNVRCKAVLIGRLFGFYDPDERECPWHQRIRYYAARLIGINDNSRPNSDIPTPFYSHFVWVLHELSVDASQPKPSKVYYMGRFKFTVTPVEARYKNTWNQHFGPGVIWKDVWKNVCRSWNDLLLRDFDWRTIHRILPVNSRLHQWNYRMPEHCARCGARAETLQHVLVHCPKIKELWMCILSLCKRIDPSVIGFSEKTLLLGCFPRGYTKDLLRYLISVGNSPLGRRGSHTSTKKMRKLTVWFISRITLGFALKWSYRLCQWMRFWQNGL